MAPKNRQHNNSICKLVYSLFVERLLSSVTVMDGGSTGKARLQGSRRYDYMEVIGRVESGTETESEARLKGFRRYDPRDGGGRAKQEARAENESGRI